MPYAILAITEFYALKTQSRAVTDDRNNVLLYRTEADAQSAAEEFNAPGPHGCHELSHNQASATNYQVRRIGWQRNTWYGSYVPSDYA